MMRHVTTTAGMILVCAFVSAVASPGWGQLVTGGLVQAHDASLYSGAGDWFDAVTGDGYDAIGTLGSSIIYEPPAGDEPGYFTGFLSTPDGDESGAITFDVGPSVIGTGDFTFSVWVNKTDPGAGQGGGPGSHAGFIGGGGFSIYQIRMGDGSSGGSLRAEISPGNTDSGNAHDPPNSGSAGSFPNAPPLFDGTWRLFTLTRSGPLNTDMAMYFDGENSTTPLGAAGSNILADLTGVSGPNINAHRASGRILGPSDRINKVLFYNRALSPAEIAQNVAAGPTALIGSLGSAPVDAVWTTDGIGLWDDASNWDLSTAPTTAKNTATFGDAISNPTTVVVDTDVTAVNAITFDHSVGYVIGGAASVTLAANTEDPPRLPKVSVAQGDHQFQVVTNLADDSSADVADGSTLSFNNALNLMGKTLTKTGAGTLAVNNRLNTGQGGLIEVQEGTLSGDGTVGGNVSNSGGTIAPGNSPGVLTIDGNLDNGGGGTVAIEIEGTAGAGDPSGHDQIQVTGSSTLAGTLDITTGAYSDPTARATVDSFTLIASAGGSTGTFDTVNFNDTALTTAHQGNGLFRNVIYDANNVTLENLFALEGDADGDKDIDITDFNILASNFDDAGANSATNDWTTADFDADGDIDITDFNFLASNFADSGYISGPDGGQVPEPATLVLLLLGGMLGFWAWRR